MTPRSPLSDEALLDQLQRAAFGYFLEAVNPANGLVADNSRANSPASIAVVGFALSSYPLAVERGWLGRDEAVRLVLATLRFFHDSDQSGRADATGFKGFYYHFLDIGTGKRAWRSELSMIDTALLVAGMLTAGRYFAAASADETELRAIVEALYLRIDWQWSQGGAETIRMGWKPECGFLHYGWDGYSEAIVLYVLALGSPTHPLKGDCGCYHAWTAT
ncbi:MAG TPA: glucoamylase family protein, partial [Lysobacter sp.]